MPSTPAGYTGAEVLDDIKATGYEPQEVSQAKDAVHDVLDSWEHNRGLAFSVGDSIELADEIVTKLIAAGAALPAQKVADSADEGPFDQLPEAGIPADFERITSPMGKHMPWGVALSGNAHGVDTAIDIGQHTLFHGPTGAGKTLALQVLALSAVSRGYDITVIDLSKGGVDWQWLAADAEVITTVSGARDTLTELREEDKRVYRVLNKDLGVINANLLTAEQRSKHDIRQRLVILDGVLDQVMARTTSVDADIYALRRPIDRMLNESRAAGVTVIGSLQGSLSNLLTPTLTNFVNHIGFGSSGLAGAAEDGHDVPTSLPAGTAYAQPGEFAAQVWMTSVEELSGQLPAARQARSQALEILFGASEGIEDA